jgi:purine-cytosine permease-like protein
MGYGFGIFLLALGLILALAVQDAIEGVDLTMVGWILAGAGVLCLILVAASTMRSRTTRTYADGSTVEERRSTPPPV